MERKIDPLGRGLGDCRPWALAEEPGLWPLRYREMLITWLDLTSQHESDKFLPVVKVAPRPFPRLVQDAGQ